MIGADMSFGDEIDPTSVTFSLRDIDEVAAISLDHNPLHCSADFARRTSFGERVVHGVLGVLAALARFPVCDASWTLSTLRVDFVGAMFASVRYRVEVTVAGGMVKARLVDGPSPVLKLVATYREAASNWFSPRRAAGMRATAQEWTDEALASAPAVAGHYAPEGEAVEALHERLDLARRGITLGHVAALLGCSYVVGMEVPGVRALFSHLKIEFPPVPPQPPCEVLAYDARVAYFDERYGLLELPTTFRAGAAVAATAMLKAFARRQVRPESPDALERALPRSTALSGQVALVTGASRGLGAAIAEALVLQGCAVWGTFLSSRSEAEALRTRLADAPGTFVAVQGNATDMEWARRTRKSLLAQHGRLDFLVCNACPPLRALSLEADALARFDEYVTSALAMVSRPLVQCLPDLDAVGGTVVLISSSVVTAPPAMWPHYVVAKSAAEALMRAAAVDHSRVRFVVARPPRLVTELTNTPLGFEDALPVSHVAARLVRALLTNAVTGARPEIIDAFA